jgi:hypothetical protein
LRHQKPLPRGRVMVEKSSQMAVPKFVDECSLTKGVEVGDILKFRKEAILYVQPCVSERGKLMADIELKREEVGTQALDPTKLCSLLEIHRRRFSYLKCSPNLGVAKLVWKGREISIFKNSKLKIQRALDKEEILRVANSVARLVWGAVICNVCGEPTINCASGKCGKCISEDEATNVPLEELPNAALLIEGRSNLKKAVQAFEQGAQEEFERALQTAKYLALFFTIEAPGKDEAVLGLVLLGEAERVEDTHRSKIRTK